MHLDFPLRRDRIGISLLAALTLVMFLASVAAANVGFTCLGTQPDPCQFCGTAGDTLCVTVDIDGTISDLRGASLVLGFDPQYVTPISVEAWDLTAGSCFTFVSWLNQFSFTNTIEVDLAGTGCSFNGPGALLRICFTGAPPDIEGTSPFYCLASDLRDSANQMIPHTCGSTSITNACPVPVKPTGWGALKHRFTTVLARNP